MEIIVIVLMLIIGAEIAYFHLENKRNVEKMYLSEDTFFNKFKDINAQILNNINQQLNELSIELLKQQADFQKYIMQILNESKNIQNETSEKIYKITNESHEASRSIVASVNDRLTKEFQELHQLFEKLITQSNDNNLAIRDLIIKLIDKNMENINKHIGDEFSKTSDLRREIVEMLTKIMETNTESQNNIAKSLKESLSEIRQMNEEKLNEINKSVSDKLDKSLNERLDSSFKQIGQQLGSLYESLGELNKLSSGVVDLNKTLSNVKTRGIWGEIQLQNILENTMTADQYETNIPTKKNSSDRVEFAIKIPSKGNDNDIIYLPIDSKFPADIYGKIVSASESGNSDAMISATKELEQRIKQEARTIKDKYIDPPNTTDFAIMFLPTESLYSEVLRIYGLYEWCQTNCKIIISGPTTITALLNSLRVGFSNLTLNKKTKDVIKILQAVKTQYKNLDELIDKTQKKLNEAVVSTENLKNRTRIINTKMSKIESLEMDESNKILQLDESDISEADY